MRKVASVVAILAMLLAMAGGQAHVAYAGSNVDEAPNVGQIHFHGSVKTDQNNRTFYVWVDSDNGTDTKDEAYTITGAVPVKNGNHYYSAYEITLDATKIEQLKPGDYKAHVSKNTGDDKDNHSHFEFTITDATPVINLESLTEAVPHTNPQTPTRNIPVVVTDENLGDTVTLTATTNLSKGSVVVSGSAPNFFVTYTAKTDWLDGSAISLTAKDSNGTTTTDTITLTRANDAPVATTITINRAHTQAATAITQTLTGAVIDPNGDSFSPTSVTLDIPADSVGSQDFDRTVTDFHGATTSIRITVISSNNAPTAEGKSDSVVHDHQYKFTPVIGDLDRWDVLSISTNAAAHGTVAVNLDGSITYSPDEHFSGPDSFSYTVTDRHQSASGDVTIDVTNAEPVAEDYTKDVSREGSVPITVLTNDTDADDVPADLTVTVDDSDSHGKATVDENGVITFTPDGDYSGEVKLTYTITDLQNASDEGTITINIGNTLPTTESITRQTGTDQFVTIGISECAHDTDPGDDDTLVFTRVVFASVSRSGLATISEDGKTITFKSGRFGTYQFAYTVEDQFHGSATGRVTARVDGIEPILECVTQISDDTYVAHWGWDSTYAETVAASSDFEGTYVPAEVPEKFAPGRNEHAFDTAFEGSSLTWTLTDPNGVERSVTAFAEAVAATAVDDDDITVVAGDTVTIPVLLNDLGVLGTTQIDSFAQPREGEGTVDYADDSQRALSYTAPEVTGTYTFTYTIVQADVSSTAEVTVEVTPVIGHLKVAMVVTGGGSLSQLFPITIYGGNEQIIDTGSVSVNSPFRTSLPLGEYLIVPGALPANYRHVSITNEGIAAVGEGNISAEIPAIITITNSYTAPYTPPTPGPDPEPQTNRVPVAQGDIATTSVDGSVTITVLQNDSDPDSDPLTVTVTTLPKNGTTKVVNGQVIYTPNTGFFGEDSFTYTISDGRGGTATATVSVTVAAKEVTPTEPPVVVIDEPIPGGGTTLPKTGGVNPVMFYGIGLAAVVLGAALRKRNDEE